MVDQAAPGRDDDGFEWSEAAAWAGSRLSVRTRVRECVIDMHLINDSEGTPDSAWLLVPGVAGTTDDIQWVYDRMEEQMIWDDDGTGTDPDTGLWVVVPDTEISMCVYHEGSPEDARAEAERVARLLLEADGPSAVG